MNKLLISSLPINHNVLFKPLISKKGLNFNQNFGFKSNAY